MFGFHGEPQFVGVETNEDTGRADILIETTEGKGIVEAKGDPGVRLALAVAQVSRYRADWRAVISTEAAPRTLQGRGIAFVRWQAIADRLELVATSSGSPVTAFLCREIIRYLEEHKMIRSAGPVEVYARPVNALPALDLFLRAKLYECNYAARGSVAGALYFAPYFGRELERAYPGIRRGISYVAKIEFVGAANDAIELRALLREKRGRDWTREHDVYLHAFDRRFPWRGERRSIVLLGKPHLIFNPPVSQRRIQAGTGHFGARRLSFDELFDAWGRDERDDERYPVGLALDIVGRRVAAGVESLDEQPATEPFPAGSNPIG